jgi:hypothetical protein
MCYYTIISFSCVECCKCFWTNLYPFLVAILYKAMADEVDSVIWHQVRPEQSVIIHDIEILLTSIMCQEECN